MTRVKICGLRRPDDALAAAAAGVDMLGFVFAPSRRRIDPAHARDIIAAVRQMALPSPAGSGRGAGGEGEKTPPSMVGIFVNASASEINAIARDCRLDLAQLSGDETNHTIEALDVPAIKVLHVGADTSAPSLRQRAAATVAEVLLLDTARAGRYGGTGEVFDWRLACDLGKPFLLAGGLDAGNVVAAIRTANPWGVDVSGGVETNGEKDQEKIRNFILTVQRHGQMSASQMHTP
jgi:phosphoribosylanthranilate isomerase